MSKNKNTIKFCAAASVLALSGWMIIQPGSVYAEMIGTEASVIEVPLSNEGAYVDYYAHYSNVVAELGTEGHVDPTVLMETATDSETVINPRDYAGAPDDEYGRGDFAADPTTTPSTTPSGSSSAGTSGSSSTGSTATTGGSSSSSASLPDTSVGTTETTKTPATVGTPDTGVFDSPAARSATIGTSILVLLASVAIVLAAKRKFSRQTREIRKF